MTHAMNAGSTSTGRHKLAIIDHSGELGGGQLGLLRYVRDAQLFTPVVMLLSGGPLVDLLHGSQTEVRVAGEALTKSGTLKQVRWLSAQLKSLNPDVIVANSLRAGIVLSAIPSVRASRIYYMREDMSLESLRGVKRSVISHFLFKRFNGFLANSEWTATTLPAPLAKRAATRVAYPISGVQEGARRATLDGDNDENVLRVLSLSRLSRWKGTHILLEAIREIEKKTDAPRIEVTIGGAPLFDSEDHARELREMASSLRNKVEFVGHVDDVQPLIDNSDVLVLGSLKPEPFGQVVLQGLANGLVVVATAHGGPSEIITDGVNGVLVPPGDSRALAETLTTLDSETRSRIGRAAIVRANDFEDPQMREAYEHALIDLAGVGGRE